MNCFCLYLTIFILFSQVKNGKTDNFPSYSISLTDEETFEISEEANLDEDYFKGLTDDSDEMIDDTQLKLFKQDANKFDLLHQLVKKEPKIVKHVKNVIVIPENVTETNMDLEEPSMYVMKRQYKRNIENSNLSYTITRNEFESFKNEYDSEIKEENSQVFNVSEEKVTQKSLNPKMKTNCTGNEKGYAATICFFKTFSIRPENKTKQLKLLHEMIKMVLILVAVYILIAVPLWCQKGWSCCCCRCKMCNPSLYYEEAQRFVLNNPVGVYHTEEGEKLKYKPTNYEKYTSRQLKMALMKI